MTDLFAARLQMALSLGFHIIFAAIGIAMPFLMAIAHWKFLKTGDDDYRRLTVAWSKGVALFFAVGAVSGTVLSFELGLLWPKFMEIAGPIIGMPFSWEGAAFFLEAIALGIFLYGWGKVSPWLHWTSGLCVGLSGVLSGLFVLCANGWMNSPSGFEWVNHEARNIDPWAAMFNRAALGQGIHMTIAAFEATGFAVAGMHAIGLLLTPESGFHRKAFEIALIVGSVAALVQPLSGDRLAKEVAVRQPLKLAAMEALFETTRRAPLVIGGVFRGEEKELRYGFEIPGMLSFLAFGELDAEVVGLNSAPRKNWPPYKVVHYAFQAMVGMGSFLALLAVASLVSFWRKKRLLHRQGFLRVLIFAMPLGFLAMEAGWIVTEVGRQPWIIYGILRTAEALTPTPGIAYTMALFAGVYLFLAFVLSWLMVRQFKNAG